MTALVLTLVGVAIAVAVVLAVVGGLDLLGLLLLVLIVAVGALGVAVARRGEKGRVAPAQCESCGGLLSPHAPFCKHCGTPVSAGLT